MQYSFANTGELNTLVTFQTRSAIPDAFGQTNSWATAFEAYARIEDLTATLLYQAGTFSSQAIHKVTISYPLDNTVTTNMQIAYNGRVFVVRNVVNPGQRNIQLDIYAEEITSAH